MVKDLASYRQCVERIRSNWPTFLEVRRERLAQLDDIRTREIRTRELGHARPLDAWERMARPVGNILEALFTIVLDWSPSDIRFGYSFDRLIIHLVLTHLGVTRLVVNLQIPGQISWDRRNMEGTLAFTFRYRVDEICDWHDVKCIGISDGVMLYAADIEAGTLPPHPEAAVERTSLQDRAFVSLGNPAPQEDLYWLSVDRISRPRGDARDAALRLIF